MAGEEGDETITLRVVDNAKQAEVHFKVKKTTTVKRIQESYAQKIGVEMKSVRLLFNGKSVDPNMTPKMLEMHEDDEFEAFLEQVGGMN